MASELGPADLQRLARWLEGRGVPGDGEPLSAQTLVGGQANLVYRLCRGEHRLVLRRPPVNAPANRDETMAREYTLLSALGTAEVPHARVYAMCTDRSVLGASFYVMDYVDGWSPASCRQGWPAPYDTDVAARRRLSFALVDGLAELGRVDWRALGLERFGRPEGFHERQVDRWLAQFEAIRFRDLPGLADAGAWLRRNQPRSWVPGVMHGDYQFHNVMYDRREPVLAAIVDWELSTVGDPLLDLAWVFMSEDWNADKFDLSGMPSHDELTAHYVQRSSRDVERIEYYLVLARFKMAVIMEGVYSRSRLNPSSGHDVAHFGDIALGLASRAADLAAGYA